MKLYTADSENKIICVTRQHALTSTRSAAGAQRTNAKQNAHRKQAADVVGLLQLPQRAFCLGVASLQPIDHGRASRLSGCLQEGQSENRLKAEPVRFFSSLAKRFHSSELKGWGLHAFGMLENAEDLRRAKGLRQRAASDKGAAQRVAALALSPVGWPAGRCR
jgi:hypothetical protein